jgi:hypothetical protein
MSDGEVAPATHTDRTYLWMGESAEGVIVGPVDMDVQVGDLIIVQAMTFQEQWVCTVDSISDHQMAEVTRQ